MLDTSVGSNLIPNSVLLGDCLEILPTIPSNSVDMILTDLPYGSTQCRWDCPIPFEPLWKEYKRIIKGNGAIVLTSAQPFTSALVMSNPTDFRYEWIWEKSKATGYLNAKRRPLVAHENILVFSKGVPPYYPQKTKGLPYNKGQAHRPTDVYGSQVAVLVKNDDGTRYPRSVQYFVTAESEGKLHPTQKPVALFEYLIRTYTKPGELVLDSCSGSGTSGVACINTGRDFVLIEKDPAAFERMKERIDVRTGNAHGMDERS